MKDRIFKNWTFTRLLYLGMGIVVIVQSILIQQWFGVIFGGYFAAMGLFAFGCASGTCINSRLKPKTKHVPNEIEFEEIKTK